MDLTPQNVQGIHYHDLKPISSVHMIRYMYKKTGQPDPVYWR